jgi:predicted 3-demethylubiquinone-9 3-methyltransferase (glyoxalase superfamily)
MGNKRYDEPGPGKPGSVMHAQSRLASQEFMSSDSAVPQPCDCTPSISVFVSCESAAELERLFEQLCEGGEVLMPLASYGFSPRFGWVQDRFGVSWQLNLA